MNNIVLIQTSFGQRHIEALPAYEAERLPVGFGRDAAFDAFNEQGPHKALRHFARYSMSVGDIVGINGEWSRCESFGWTALTTQEVSTIVNELIFL